MAIGEVKDRQHLPTGDGGVKLQKLVNGFAAFEQINQTLNRHARTPEAWHTAYALGANPDRLIKPIFLFRRHTVKVRNVCPGRNSFAERVRQPEGTAFYVKSDRIGQHRRRLESTSATLNAANEEIFTLKAGSTDRICIAGQSGLL